MATTGSGFNDGTVFAGRIVMIGCSSIGQSVLPLLQNHLGDIYKRVTVISADEAGRKVAERLNVKFIHCNLTPGNFRQFLKNYVAEGDFVPRAQVARDLNVTIIQMSERDTQASQRPKRQG